MYRASRWLSARGGVSLRPIGLYLAVVGFAGFGCSTDTRIDIDTLRELEQSVAATSQPVEMPKASSLKEFQPYQVGPGDVLSISMISPAADPPDRTLRIRVNQDGLVTLPMVGEVKLQGLTLSGVDDAIRRAYAAGFIKDLVVYTELVQPLTTTVVVVGDLVQQGLVTLPSNERNVLYAITAAGGVSIENTRRVRVRPVRPDEPEIEYNLTNADDLRRALTAPPLESGDLIFVDAAEESAIYISGVVNRPGPILIPRSSSLGFRTVIAAVGGFRDYLTVRDATLLRRLPDGQVVRVKLEVNKIMNGELPDLQLRAGDVVQVPSTLDTFAQEWVLKNLLLGPFRLGVNYDPLAQYNANRVIAEDGSATSNAVRQSLGSNLPSVIVPPVVPPSP